MKKILIVLITILILSGCTQKGYSQLSDGDEVIFRGKDIEYKKSDLYKSLKISSDSIIENDILQKIAVDLEVDIDSLYEEAQAEIEMYTSLYDEATLMAYKEQLVSEKIIEKLNEIYLDDNIDEFIANDNPIQMQMVTFYDENSANLFLESVNNGTDFAEAATNSGSQDDCSIRIYLNSDITYESVTKYIEETDTVGLSKILVDTTSEIDENNNTVKNSTYTILNIVSKNIDDYKDEYKTLKLESIDVENMKKYFFANHNIKFYDQDLYEIMYTKYEELK